MAANDTTKLTVNTREVFKCMRNAGLKLAISKCHFGVKQDSFFLKHHYSRRCSRTSAQNQDAFVEKNFQKHKRHCNGTLVSLSVREFLSHDFLKNLHLFQIVKSKPDLWVQLKLMQTFHELNASLNKLMTDATLQPHDTPS